MDVREYLRLGRHLWVIYTEPLRRENVNTTLGSIKSRNNSSDDETRREILTMLGQRFISKIKVILENDPFAFGLESGLLQSPQSKTAHHIPELAKYLLISSWLCQVNRPDRDRELFTMQKTGRRRHTVDTASTTTENIAYGSALAVKQTKSRGVPFERILSVFVSLVGLNDSRRNQNDGSLQALGTNVFNETLASLRDIGLLYERPVRTEPIHSIEPRYFCSLTKEEAFDIASSLGISLERYLRS